MRMTILALCLMLVACERVGKYDSAALASLEPRVRAVLVIESELNNAHPYQGVSALTFIRNLKQEGYECRAQYRETVSFNQAAEGRITTVPWVVCFMAPAMIDMCSELSVGLDFPSERRSDIRSLVTNLGSLETEKPSFVCEVTPTGAEAKKKISLATKQGYVIPID
jgi:hypothetical protein